MANNYHGTVESTGTIWIDPISVNYENHENNLKVSVFNNGLIGGYFIGYDNQSSIGDGICFNNKNGLYAGGIFLTLSNGTMAGRPYMEKQANNDFLPITQTAAIESPIPGFDQAFCALYNDRRFEKTDGKMGLTITQNSYSSNTIPTNGFV